MRKAILIAGVAIGVLILVVAALVFYCVENLDSIVAENRSYVVGRVSDSLGRSVAVSDIKVSVGWGVMVDLSHVTVGDDPAVSQHPFIEANDIYAKVMLLPLLSRRLRVTELILDSPAVHIIRTESGRYNFSTLGRKSAANSQAVPELRTGEKQRPAIGGAPLTAERGQPPAPAGRRGGLAGLYVNAFTVRNGRLTYEALGYQHRSATVTDVALSITDFSLDSPFQFALRLAAFHEKQNVDISGTVGPLAKQGQIDTAAIPFKLNATLGPLVLARLRAIPELAEAMPEKLSLPDPVTVEARLDGNPRAAKFHFASDLTSDRVAWADAFNKPASLAFNVSADGWRSDSTIEIVQTKVKLADLDAKAEKIKFGGGNLSARIDTNRFDIGSIAKLVPALAKYNASGHVEAHSDLSVVQKKFEANGIATLADVAFGPPGAKGTPISKLNGDIKLHGGAADAAPLKFDLASGHATLNVHAVSFQPINATYDFNVDTIRLADLVPNRPPEEHLGGVASSGKLASEAGAIAADTKLTSAEGNLADVPYKNLELLASLAGKQLNLKSLKFAAFTGDVSANGQATFGSAPEFALNLDAGHVDLEQALQSQKAKAAGIIRGILNGQLKVTGKGAKFDDIKPTLHGNGRAEVKDGKLVGLNVVADALGKIKNLPEIGDLVPASIIEKHSGLFRDPDTELQNASLTFMLEGPKISTNDLKVGTQDYSILGKGWFDMDKTIDMTADIVLSQALTADIIAQKKNVVYVTNQQGLIDVPVAIRGALPKPIVAPDIPQMAQRAGHHVIERKGQQLLQKLLPGAGATPGAKPSPGAVPKPLEQLKKLLP